MIQMECPVALTNCNSISIKGSVGKWKKNALCKPIFCAWVLFNSVYMRCWKWTIPYLIKQKSLGCFGDSLPFPLNSRHSEKKTTNRQAEGRIDLYIEIRGRIWNKFVYTTWSVANVGQGHWWKLDHLFAWIRRFKKTCYRRTNGHTDPNTESLVRK